MTEFLKAAKVGDVESGPGRVVVTPRGAERVEITPEDGPLGLHEQTDYRVVLRATGAGRVALGHRDGVYYAIKNSCPHMGGELGEGLLQGDVVTCPWHGWRFNVKTGKNPEADVVGVRTFEVRVEGDEIFIGI